MLSDPAADHPGKRPTGAGSCETRIEAGRRARAGSPLFEQITRFAFADREQGVLHLRGLRLGTATAAYLESSGHDVALLHVGAAYIAPLSGRLRVETSRGVIATGEGGCVMLRTDAAETILRSEGRDGFRALLATIRSPTRQSGIAGLSTGRAIPRVADDPRASGLHEFVAWLMEDAARPGSPVLRPVASRAAEAMLLDLFSDLDPIAAPESEAGAFGPAEPVRLAMAFMRAHADRPMTVAGVAAALGLTVRALRRAFRSCLDATPRAVLTEIRLDRARARLQSPHSGLTAADAARDCGFTHLGRFAAAYHRRFGESPADTLRRASDG